MNRGKEKGRDRHMRIDNTYVAGLTPGEIRANTEASEVGQKTGAPAEKTAEIATHVPSPELANLQQLVQMSPDVRPEAVARASQLLESGYYASSAAAARTAEAIAQSID
jgi:hypothetical protein